MNKALIKIAAFVLAASMMLSGCDNSATQEPSPTPTATVSQEPTPSPEASPEAEPEVTPEPSADDNLPPEEKIAKQAVDIIDMHMQKNLTYQPLKDPNNEFNLAAVKNTRMVGMVTGEYSVNQTKTNYGVGGTDLGVMFNHGDTTYIAFGDTFAKEGMKENWRSNVLAYTTDGDYTDGIVFDGMIMANTGAAKELLRGQKQDNIEVTKIPTGAIVIGDAFYMSYMSVKHWGVPGEWDCNYGSVAKSVDGGKSWQYLNDLKWPGDSCFAQMAPVRIDDMIYIPGISGGRSGVARMMRVPVSEYENFDAYEYLTAINDDGTPVFEKDALDRAYAILPRAVGEMSFMYNDYLEEWLVTYISGEDIVLRSAKNIWGPYSAPVTIAAQKDFPGLYGAFMNPRYVSEDGKKIGFLMSLWDPVYNVAIMECELERK